MAETLNNMEALRVKRSWQSYGGYLIWLLLAFSNIFVIHTSWRTYWIFIGLLSIVILIRLIFKPYYFEIRGSRFVIIRDFFYEEYVELDSIEKIELSVGVFSRSHIKLKNGIVGLDFNYFIVNDRDFVRLKETLQLTIE